MKFLALVAMVAIPLGLVSGHGTGDTSELIGEDHVGLTHLYDRPEGMTFREALKQAVAKMMISEWDYCTAVPEPEPEPEPRPSVRRLNEPVEDEEGGVEMMGRRGDAATDKEVIWGHVETCFDAYASDFASLEEETKCISDLLHKFPMSGLYNATRYVWETRAMPAEIIQAFRSYAKSDVFLTDLKNIFQNDIWKQLTLLISCFSDNVPFDGEEFSFFNEKGHVLTPEEVQKIVLILPIIFPQFGGEAIEEQRGGSIMDESNSLRIFPISAAVEFFFPKDGATDGEGVVDGEKIPYLVLECMQNSRIPFAGFRKDDVCICDYVSDMEKPALDEVIMNIMDSELFPKLVKDLGTMLIHVIEAGKTDAGGDGTIVCGAANKWVNGVDEANILGDTIIGSGEIEECLALSKDSMYLKDMIFGDDMGLENPACHGLSSYLCGDNHPLLPIIKMDAFQDPEAWTKAKAFLFGDGIANTAAELKSLKEQFNALCGGGGSGEEPTEPTGPDVTEVP